MFGFRRVGKRVTINAKGDLMLRPSYFEMSVTHGGTSARHHLAGSYALSLAAILKAQVRGPRCGATHAGAIRQAVPAAGGLQSCGQVESQCAARQPCLHPLPCRALPCCSLCPARRSQAARRA